MSNWYARKLSGDGSSTPRAAPPLPPPATRGTPAQSTPTSSPQPHTQRVPPSARQDEHCPECGSANYMAPQGSQLKRCMECNYPTIQSGSGIGGMGQTDGSVKAAKQPASGGYNPGQIVGRVE